MSANTPQPRYSRVKVTWRPGDVLSCSLTSCAKSSFGFASSHRRIVNHLAASYRSQPSGLPAPFQPCRSPVCRKRNEVGKGKKIGHRVGSACTGNIFCGGHLTPVRFTDHDDSASLRLFASSVIVPATPPAIHVAPTQAAISHFHPRHNLPHRYG